MSAVVKQCKCGRCYTADAWSKLPAAGCGLLHIAADETGPAETYDHRNCACGSTLVVMTVDGAS